jgi:ABC-type transporter Mla maintaining outer membrane lipid asymmetry ATPase subunit MlaF
VLLKLILGLHRPDAGAIYVKGRSEMPLSTAGLAARIPGSRA